MSLIWRDRVLETSGTNGTGDFTLAGAVTGFRAFSAVCATNDTVYYFIEAVDGSGVPTGAWETGIGTYSAANTLTRTIVLDSSNSGALVSFASGTKLVGLTEPAAKVGFRGALVKKSADQTAANYTTATAIAWDAEEYDTSGIHDNSTNNTRLTVPFGVSHVRVSASVTLANITTGQWNVFFITKNGSGFIGRGRSGVSDTSITNATFETSTAVVSVTPGDYFEVLLEVESDTSIDISASTSWFAMEIIE